MITMTMAPSEMFNEVIGETGIIFGVSDAKQAKVDKIIRKAVKYPCRVKSKHTTGKRNKWLLCWIADNKKMVGDDCLFYAACLVDSSDGMYMLLPQSIQGNWGLLIFTPHFFKRYAERHHVDKRGVDLRHHYLLHNSSYHIKPISKDWQNYRDGSVVATITDGMILGYLTDDPSVCIIKTFISYDMVKDEQAKDVALLEVHRKEIHGY